MYLNNASTLHVADNRTYSSRVNYIALRYCFVQELVKGGKNIIHYVNTHSQLADLSTKHPGRSSRMPRVSYIFR